MKVVSGSGADLGFFFPVPFYLNNSRSDFLSTAITFIQEEILLDM